MMKEKLVRLKNRVRYFYFRNTQSIKERRLKNNKSQLQIALLSGSVKRIK